MRPGPGAGFRPAWWLPGGHLQTLGGKYMRPPVHVPLRRERLETPDGDFLDLDFGPDPDAQRPLVLLLHGLEGFSTRPYMLHAMAVLGERGLASAGLNFRGCSGEPNRLPRFYHSGETGDTTLVLESLRARWPRRPLAALGISLGGNVLIKMLGEREDGGTGLVQAAAGLSVPFDLIAGVAHLEGSPVGRFYARYFLSSLAQKIQAKREILDGLIDLDEALAARTLTRFDDVATAPLHGFASAREYYARSSANQYLPGVRVPTIFIHARNDPFLPAKAIPEREMAANPRIEALISRGGGHVGFITGSVPGRPGFWAEDRIASFLARQLS